MTLKPQEGRDNQAGSLHKKTPSTVPNGLSLEPCRNNFHHQSSDQENNPRLAHSQGKKKKHLNKKHTMVSYEKPKKPVRVEGPSLKTVFL